MGLNSNYWTPTQVCYQTNIYIYIHVYIYMYLYVYISIYVHSSGAQLEFLDLTRHL